MRKIKFRGRHQLSGVWVYGYYVKDELIDYIDNGKGVKFAIYPETLGQFTGLKDKNGKEIYDGDIIHYEVSGPYNQRNLIVSWLNYHAGWALATKVKNIGEWAIKMDGQQGRGNYPPISNYEVIGNIYDNPELLNND